MCVYIYIYIYIYMFHGLLLRSSGASTKAADLAASGLVNKLAVVTNKHDNENNITTNRRLLAASILSSLLY